MKYSITLRKVFAAFSTLSLTILFSHHLHAQTNVALTATASQIVTGSGVGAPPTGYGAGNYNDACINPFPATTCVGYVAGGGWIKFAWPTVQFDIGKIVFYKNDRPMANCLVQYWDAASQTYIGQPYTNYTNNIVDSIQFYIPVSTDTIRLFNITGPQSNPNFREIQIWGNMPPCFGLPSANNIQATYSGTVYSLPTTTIPGVCAGSTVFFNSLSNITSYGHTYQWQRSPDNINWTSIPGATDMGYVAEILSNTYYRVVDTCAGSTLNSASTAMLATTTAPVYQTVPYFQSFETWNTGCAPAPYSNDVPGPGWTSNPSIGDSSWRSSQQGTGSPAVNTAGWTSLSTGAFTPLAAPGSGTYAARFHSSAVPAFNPGNLNLHLDCSSPVGDKQMYFYFINASSGTPGGDSLNILMSTDFGATWTKLASFDTAGVPPLSATNSAWKKRSVPIQTNSPNTIIRFQGMKNNNSDNTDIGVDSVYVAPPCSGNPTAGNITLASPLAICAGATYTLTTTGTTMAGGLVYTWQQSTNGGVFYSDVPPGNGSGANTLYFTTPPLYDTIYYRLKVQCGPTGTPDYTAPVIFYIVEPLYAAIPYAQNFENWTSMCGYNNNIPVSAGSVINWANTPGFGNNSWRRDDLGGTSAGWTNTVGITGYPYYPAPGLAHFARFHSNGTPSGTAGNLDLLVDCNTSAGSKELTFYYMNPTGNDSLRIFLSKNGGGSFTKIGAFNQAPVWTQYMLLIPSDSLKTVIRFQGYSESGGTDIGLDSIRLIPPCSGSPVAGVISATSPCAGVNFTMSLLGTTIAAGLTYQWQDSIPNGAWNSIAGATNTSYTTSITTNTYYRVFITCTNSGNTVVTPVKYVQLAAFYYCYCGSGATQVAGADIGNFTVKKLPSTATILNNGIATPSNNNGGANKIYTDFRNTIPPIPLYLDSMYKFFVTQINSSAFTASTVTIWLDTNHNGIFDGGEKIFHKVTSTASNPAQQVSDTFKIPHDALVGITGLRVVMEQPVNGSPAPCSYFTNGETEDYLAEIRYPPCDGPTNAGTAYISDTSGCVGYTITVVDTSHEHFRHNLTWVWQYSPDGNSWAPVAGSQGRDTVEQVITGPTFFRMRMICFQEPFTFDTTYSNVVSVVINPPFSCYCYSASDGGPLDSSDIGAFSIGSFLVNVGGPHVKNSQAFRSHTDYTKLQTIELWQDSTYPVTIYHIMRSDFHEDAKVTMFMDFNNNLQYDVTPNYSERVLTTITTANNFTYAGNITIPHFAISDLKTGMRLIINNNTAPNIPSDEACGTYTSGETEDYLVIFRSALSVPYVGNISALLLYPNPTEGRFTLTFTAQKPVEQTTITVTNITGQKVLEKQYPHAGKEFTRELDLSGMSKGVYLVELKADQEKLVKKVIVK